MAPPRSLARLLNSLNSLGAAGAVANAYQACEERKLVEARIDALAVRLSPVEDQSDFASGVLGGSVYRSGT